MSPSCAGWKRTNMCSTWCRWWKARLRDDCSPIDLLRTSFPGGSVTGAPKIRAMEIIAELEPTVRGAYCGSLGYIGLDGRMDTSILIRTITASPRLVAIAGRRRHRGPIEPARRIRGNLAQGDRHAASVSAVIPSPRPSPAG